MSDQMHNTPPRATREETAKAEIGHTEIAPATARVLVACFLAAVVVVPVIRIAGDLLSDSSQLPQPLDAFRLPAKAARTVLQNDGSLVDRVFAANADTLRSIKAYEAALADGSPQGRWIRPAVQEFTADWLGQGNEKVLVGRDGWLFHAPAVHHVTGPGFLTPTHQARRRAEGNEYTPAPQGDPVKAIVQFNAQLRERGIRLVVVPVPGKAMVHPDKFSDRFAAFTGVLHNASFKRFTRDLEAAGVLVFDPAPLLARSRRSSGAEQFLRADTHWTPEAMDLVARDLGEYIAEHVTLRPRQAPYAQAPAAVKVCSVGDMTKMLGLPQSQGPFDAQTVEIRPVLEPGRKLRWRPRKTAHVLLLGDSFTNIYSLDSLGWGDSAGLAEQLSYHMQRPVDRIARNDSGAYATRQTLSRHLAAGRDRLAGKRVVVWQFAARELSDGDWKLMDMALGAPRPSRFIEPTAGGTMVVTGTVSAVSAVPRPGSVPYTDHICQIHLTDLRDEWGKDMADSEALVFMWSMRDKTLTRAARYREGQAVTVRVEAWTDGAETLHGRINRSEFSEDEIEDVWDKPVCWGQEVSP